MGNLYDTIIDLCDSRGIKGGKMCSDVGISKGLMTDLKMGRRTGVSAVTAQKIAAYFGVSVGYLLGEEEKGEKKEQPIEIDGLSDKQRAILLKIMQMSDTELDRVEKVLSLVENKV